MNISINTFDSARSDFTSRMAQGHMIQRGHTLTGYYIEVEAGIHNLIRTCCE